MLRVQIIFVGFSLGLWEWESKLESVIQYCFPLKCALHSDSTRDIFNFVKLTHD